MAGHTGAAGGVVVDDGAPSPGHSWGYCSGRFLAFGHDFGLRCSDPALGRYLASALAPLAAPGRPARRYSLVEGGGEEGDRCAVHLQGERITTADRCSAVSALFWDINRRAVESASPRYVLLHAAAAEWQGTALLFPAEMEAGKSTLVAGLVLAGLRYLTDEVVALDPASGLVAPFPKPISLDTGSWDTLASLEPQVDPALRSCLRWQWHVDPRSIRPDVVAPASSPGFLVFPRYERGARTELTPMRGSEAVLALYRNSFNAHDHGAAALELLASVVRRSDRYRLVSGDLDGACAAILGLLSDVREAKA